METQHLKELCVTIFGEAKFDLHKWHSNELALEAETKPIEPVEPSYAKEQVGVKPEYTSLLGVPWDNMKEHYESEVS